MNKILVVDDDNTLLETLNYNLSNEGYTVFTVADGVQAIEIARIEARPEEPEHLLTVHGFSYKFEK